MHALCEHSWQPWHRHKAVLRPPHRHIVVRVSSGRRGGGSSNGLCINNGAGRGAILLCPKVALLPRRAGWTGRRRWRCAALALDRTLAAEPAGACGRMLGVAQVKGAVDARGKRREAKQRGSVRSHRSLAGTLQRHTALQASCSLYLPAPTWVSGRGGHQLAGKTVCREGCSAGHRRALCGGRHCYITRLAARLGSICRGCCCRCDARHESESKEQQQGTAG